VAYLPDGTMVVINGAHNLVGQQVESYVQALHQTGSGVIVFADLKVAATLAGSINSFDPSDAFP
jgi:uncharacterized protein YacL